MREIFLKTVTWGLLFGAVLSASCGDSQPQKNTVQKQISISTTVKTLTSAVDAVTCLDYVKALETVSLSKEQTTEITISINTNKIYDEATLVKWLENFDAVFFSKTPCAIATVHFTVLLDAENVYSGVLRKADNEMRAANKISEAEWVRRFEIQRVETLASLTVVLKNARETADTKAALQVIDKIIDKDAGNSLWRLIKANTLLESGAYFEAIAVYEALLENSPKDLRALYNLSFAHKHVGNFSKSLDLYQKIADEIASADKELPFAREDFYLSWADAYLHNNQPREALEKKKLAGDSTGVNGLLIEANALRLLKLFNDAKRVLEKALTLQENEAVVLFDLTLIQLDLKDEEGAKVNFAKLKESDAGLAAELSFLSLFGGSGKPVSAATAVETAVQTETTSSMETGIVLETTTSTSTGTEPSTFNPSDEDDEESRF